MKFPFIALTTLRTLRLPKTRVSIAARVAIPSFAALLGTFPLILACLLFYPQTARAQTPEERVKVISDVPYGTADGHPLLLDIYQPTDIPSRLHPAIVMIHGGSWFQGDKSSMSAFAHFLAQSGFVVLSINYRLLKDGQNRWPAQLDDAQRSVRWIRANAAKYGVNPDHVGAYGHSAGAQIAALLGMMETRDNSDPALASYSSKVSCVAEAAGPIDFSSDHDTDGDELITNLLGGSFKQHPDLWHNASPIAHVAKDNVPFLVIHGTHDQDVSFKQSEEFTAALEKAGVPVTFLKLDDNHSFEKPESRHQLAFASLMFFQKYLLPTS